MFFVTALSPYLLLKSSTAISTASTEFLPDSVRVDAGLVVEDAELDRVAADLAAAALRAAAAAGEQRPLAIATTAGHCHDASLIMR